MWNQKDKCGWQGPENYITELESFVMQYARNHVIELHNIWTRPLKLSPLVWVDGCFGPIRNKSDDVISWMSVLTSQKWEQWHHVWTECPVQFRQHIPTQPPCTCSKMLQFTWKYLQNHFSRCMNIVVLAPSYKSLLQSCDVRRHRLNTKLFTFTIGPSQVWRVLDSP